MESRVECNISLSPGSACRVHAYAEITVASSLDFNFKWSVIRHVFIPSRSFSRFLISSLITAKPMPCILCSFSAFPSQKKVCPAPLSVRCPSPAWRVSWSAAISILYWQSSQATKAVRLSCLSLHSVSIRVYTFHVPKRSCCFLRFWLYKKEPVKSGFPARDIKKQTMLRIPFLIRFPMWGEQSGS